MTDETEWLKANGYEGAVEIAPGLYQHSAPSGIHWLRPELIRAVRAVEGPELNKALLRRLKASGSILWR